MEIVIILFLGTIGILAYQYFRTLNHHQKFEMTKKIAQYAVRVAEQKNDTLAGPEQKAFAGKVFSDWMESHKIKFNLSTEQIDEILEFAWAEMKQALSKVNSNK
ncbi:MAG: phage holin [Lactobacillaceae bacterium]|jgi:LL-H family phage holin|nr:phage holin [Lactobacillaceae bacterium]